MDLKAVTVLLHLALANCQQFCISPTPICDCFVDKDGMKVINCRYKGLNQVPVFSQTNELYDSIIFTSTEQTGTCRPESGCNNITNLNADAFANLDVKIIDLRNNAITHFDQNAFRGLEDMLNVLLIEGDMVNNPPYKSISLLRRLLSLHLKHFQQIQMTNKNTQLNFPQLLTLTLDNIKGLEIITPTVFSQIPKLTYLFLQHMQSMRILPVAAILNLPNLEVLSIADTKISRIFGDSFTSLNVLHSIEISENSGLVTIDAHAFRGVEDSLETLTLSTNSLSSSILNMFQTLTWGALKQLELGYNTFGSIPDGVFRTMSNLQYLGLQSTSLSTISQKMLAGLTKLHTIDLGFNSIDRIPASAFQSSPYLKELRLNDQQTKNNPINFAANAFKGIENTLQCLIVERNTLNISQLWDQIAKLTNITVLELEYVGLTEIPDRAFARNINLTRLDLSDNKIQKLTHDTFYGPQHLSSINLQNNKINTVDKCVFNNFVNIPSIRLVGNPLVCDCRIAWFYDSVLNKTDSVSSAINYAGMCSFPADLKGKYFFQFDRSQLTCPSGYVEAVCKNSVRPTLPYAIVG